MHHPAQDPHDRVSRSASQPMLLSGSGAEETNDVPKAPGAERGLIADQALSLSRCTSEAGGRRGAWSNEKGEAFGGFGIFDLLSSSGSKAP